jgi:hypothetical protein
MKMPKKTEKASEKKATKVAKVVEQKTPTKRGRKPGGGKPSVASERLVAEGDEEVAENDFNNLILLDSAGTVGMISRGRQYEVWKRTIYTKTETVKIIGREYNRKAGEYSQWDQSSVSYFGRLEHALRHAVDHVLRQKLKDNSVKTVDDILKAVLAIKKDINIDIFKSLMVGLEKG